VANARGGSSAYGAVNAVATQPAAATSASILCSSSRATAVAAGEPGGGLANMSERLHAVHASLNTRIEHGRFTLTAVVPRIARPSGDHSLVLRA
jgi:hypothetical protein